MNILYHVLILLNAFATSLLVGGMVEVALADVPVFLALPNERFVEVHRILDSHIDRYMPALTFAAVLSALVALFLPGGHGQTASESVGLVGLLGVIGISQFFSVPLNRRIRSWNEASSENIQALKWRWIFFHRFRTILGCCSLLCFLISLVASF